MKLNILSPSFPQSNLGLNFLGNQTQFFFFFLKKKEEEEEEEDIEEFIDQLDMVPKITNLSKVVIKRTVLDCLGSTLLK